MPTPLATSARLARPAGLLALALLAACEPQVAGPERLVPLDASLAFEDSVLTAGERSVARVVLPEGYRVEESSVHWDAPSVAAVRIDAIAGDSAVMADVALLAPARVRIRGDLIARRRADLGTSGGVAGPAAAGARYIRVFVDTIVDVHAPVLAVTGQPAGVTVAGAELPSFVVEYRDIAGRRLVGRADSVALELVAPVGSDASLEGTAARTAVDGEARFTALRVTRADSGYRLVARGAFGATATSASFRIRPGAASAQLTTASLSADRLLPGAVATLTVRFHDVYGNPLDSVPAGALTLGSAGGQYGAMACDGGVCTAPWTAPTRAGAVSISIAYDGQPLAQGSIAAQVLPGDAAVLVPVGSEHFTGVVDAVLVGAPTVQVQDLFGNAVPGAAVRFSTSGGTLAGVSVVSDSLGVAVAPAWRLGTRAGEQQLVVETGAASRTFGATVAPDAASPDSSSAVAAAAQIDAGDSTTITIDLRDRFGNAVASASPGDLSLVPTTGTLTGLACAQARCTVRFVAGTVAAAPDVSVLVAAAPLATGPVHLIVRAAPPSAMLVVAGEGQVGAAGSALAVAPAVRVVDRWAQPVGGVRVTFTTVDIDGTTPLLQEVLSDSLGVARWSGDWVLGRRAGAQEMHVVAEPMPSTPAVVGATVIAAAPSIDSTSIVVADSTLEVGDSTVIEVVVRDAFGNIVLDATPADVQVSAGSGSLGSFTCANGICRATWIAPSTPGAPVVSLSVGGSAPVAVAIDVAASSASAAHSSAALSAGTVVAGDSVQLAVIVRDALGNRLGAGPAVVVQAVSGASRIDLGALAFRASDSTHVATIVGRQAGAGVTFGVTVDAAAVPATLQLTVLAGAAFADSTIVTVSRTTITADGSDSTVVTVQLRDRFGNPLTRGGDAVSVAAGPGTVGPVVDRGDGTYVAVVTAPAATGSAVVSTSVAGVPVASADTLTFASGPASATTSALEITAADLSVGGDTTTITIRLRDAQGNPITVGGADLVLSASAGVIGSIVDNGDGTYTARYVAGTVAGPVNISGALGGQPLADSATIVVHPGAASPDSSTVSIARATVRADGSDTTVVTVRLRDAYGNPVDSGGAAIAISAAPASVGPITDNGDGTYTAIVTAPVGATTVAVQATVDGTPLADSDSIHFVAADPDLAMSELLVADSTLAAGVDTTTVTIRLRDASGTPLTVSGGSIVVTASAGTVGAVVDNGDGTYTIRFIAPSAAGAVLLSATLDGQPLSDSVTLVVAPGAASATTSTLVAARHLLVADGADTTAITVELKDAFGNAVGAGGSTVVLASTAGAVGAVSDLGNGSYSAILVAPAAPASGVISATLDGTTLTARDTVVFEVGTAAASQSEVSIADTTLAAGGDTTTIIVRLRDASGNPLVAGGDSVVISVSGGAVGAVVDNGDGTYSVRLTSPSGTGPIQVTASVGGVALPDTLVIAITAGAPSTATSTVVASSASLAANGTDTTTVTVRLRDAFGNAIGASAGVVVIAATPGTVSAVTDQGDGSYTAVLTAPAAPGLGVISATLDGAALASQDSVSFGVGAAAAAQSELTLSDSSLVAGGDTTTATVRLRDASGNPLTTGGGTVVIAVSGGTIGSVVDVGDGSYRATITGPDSVGPVRVSATLNGSALPDTIQLSITPAAPSTVASTVALVPSALVANGTDTASVTVLLYDAFGNAIGASAGVVVVSSSAGSVSGVTDHGDGHYTALLTAPSIASSAVISATLDGTTLTARDTVVFNVGAASAAQSELTVSDTALVAGGDTASAVVRLRDASGNLLVASGGTVVISVSGGSAAAVVDQGDGTYRAVITSPNTVGSVNVSATLDGVALPDTVQVSVGPAAPSTTASTLAISAPSIVANGSDTATVLVRLRDAYGNVIGASGGTVVFSATAGTIATVTDHGDGSYTAILTAPTAVGTGIVSATLDGTPLTAADTIAFLAGPASAGASDLTIADSALVAGGDTVTVTVRLRDASGNLVGSSGGTVAFASSGGSLGSVVDHGDGTYSAVLTSPTGVGSLQVTATLDGAAFSDTLVVLVAPGAASLTASTVAASAPSLTANGTDTTTVTIQLRDAFGNAIGASAGVVVVSSSAGSVSAVTDHGDGSYTAILAAPTAVGTGIVSATLDGTPLTSADTLAFVAGAAALAQSEFVVADSTLSVGGDSTTVTVRLRDAFGNAVAAGGDTITIGANAGTVSSVTDHGDGRYTALFNSSTTAGAVRLAATVNGIAFPDSVDITVSPAAADLDSSTISASRASLTADGADTTLVTVRLRDTFGNLVGASGGTVVIAASAGTIGAVSDLGDGSYTAVLTAPATLGEIVLDATLQGQALTATDTVATVPGALDHFDVTDTTGAALAAFALNDSSAVRIAARDATGHLIATFAGAVELTATGATLVGAPVTAGTFSGGYAIGYATFSSSGAVVTITATHTTSSATGTSAAFAVSALDLAFETAAAGARSGIAMTTQPVVQLRDNGAPLATAGVTISASVVGAPGNGMTLTSASAVTDAAGRATFSGLALTGAVGAYTLRFSATGYSALDGAVTLTAGDAAALRISGVDTVVTTAISEPFTVRVVDGAGNTTVAGAGGVVVTASDASGTSSGRFLADNAGSVVLSGGQFTIAAGDSSGTYFYQDTAAIASPVTRQLRVTATGFAGDTSAVYVKTGATASENYVCRTNGNPNASSASIGIAGCAEILPGHLLVAGVVVSDAVTIAAPAGWTLAGTVQGTGGGNEAVTIAVYTRIATSADASQATYTFSWSGSKKNVGSLLAYENVVGVDAVATRGSSAGGNTVLSSSATPSVNNTTGVYVFGLSGGNSGAATATGWTVSKDLFVQSVAAGNSNSAAVLTADVDRRLAAPYGERSAQSTLISASVATASVLVILKR